MAKHEMRVDFTGAPKHVVPHLYGNVKDRKGILAALKYFDGHAHEKEIFHFLNTNEQGKWLVTKIAKGTSAGKLTVPVSMTNLRQQLATMIEMGDVKRLGERSGRYALPSYEEPEDEDENGEPEAAEEDEEVEEVDEDE